MNSLGKRPRFTDNIVSQFLTLVQISINDQSSYAKKSLNYDKMETEIRCLRSFMNFILEIFSMIRILCHYLRYQKILISSSAKCSIIPVFIPVCSCPIEWVSNWEEIVIWIIITFVCSCILLLCIEKRMSKKEKPIFTLTTVLRIMIDCNNRQKLFIFFSFLLLFMKIYFLTGNVMPFGLFLFA